MKNRDATWKITVDDGFTKHCYTIERSRGDVSIRDIGKLVHHYLDSLSDLVGETVSEDEK